MERDVELNFVTTLTLGSWLRQGHAKVEVGNATRESHSHFQEFGRVWWNDLTLPNGFLKLQRAIWGGQNSLDWKKSYIIGKLLKCLKWGHIIQSSIHNTSCDWKKGQKSKCQFDFQPLKVENCLELLKWKACHIFLESFWWGL